MSNIDKINEDIFDFGQNSTLQELENILNKASDSYYNTSKPLLEDAQFDILVDFLRKRFPKSLFLKNIGAPTKNKKVKLDYYLGSMDKIKPPSSKLDNWKKVYKSPYYLSDKLDGISGLIIYNDNKVKLMTRGTATEGADISNLIKYLNLPSYDDIESKLKKLKLFGKKNMIALRGEIIMSKTNFIKYKDDFKNPRNLVSGIVNSKTKNPKISSDLDFIIYNILDPIKKFKDQMSIISKLGFKNVYYQKEKDINFSVLSTILKQRKNNSDYEVDGIIVTDNNTHQLQTNKNPEYAFAFKELLEDTFKETIIQDIEWNVSKNGVIVPTVIVKSIELSGVTVSRVSAFNAKYVKDNRIGKGAKIQITRSGDVIPYIVKVIETVEPQFPDMEYKWSETGVDIIILNECDEQKIRQIYFFFKTLETKGFGLKLIVKLYEKHFNSIQKILMMKKEDFLKLQNVKEKSANNFYEELNRIKKIKYPIEKLILATNSLGNNFGIRKAKLLFKYYPDILKEKIKNNSINKLVKVPGIEKKTALQIIKNWSVLLSNIKWLKKYFKIQIKKPDNKNTNLKYKTWVLTGFRDKELQEKIENMGGKISSTISKNTDILVIKDKNCLDNPSSKILKAQQLKIKIIVKSDIHKFI